jgi:uracil-DNA glycosylase
VDDNVSDSTQTDRDETAEALAALRDSLRDCNRCGLCGGRTQVVFGVGDPHARLLFVGEGPGFHEDKQGEPFVGAAGKLLTELLGQIGLTRRDVYIANVVKCRPPENRDPLPDEIAACSPHLMEQIAIIRPRVICTLGRFATKLLADTELSMTAIHGKAKPLTMGGVELVVFPVFHPAAALYQPSNRRVLEEDFAKLRILLARGLNAKALEPAVSAPFQAAEAPAVADVAEAPIIAESPIPQAPAGARADKQGGPSADRREQLPLW